VVDLPGDMPITFCPIADNKIAINTCGFHDHSLSILDTVSETVTAKLPFKNDWMGLITDPQGNFLISLGKVDNGVPAIARIRYQDGALSDQGGITLPSIPGAKARFVSGILSVGDLGFLALDTQNDRLYRIDWNGQSYGPGIETRYRPYMLAKSPDGQTVAVSNWGDSSVSFYAPDSLSEKAMVPVGHHPTAMVYAPDGRLFVSNAGGDTVSVISGTKVVKTIRVTVSPRQTVGATPVALALDPKSMRLYVALAGNNCVAVVDAKGGNVLGFIPTARYPSAVAVSADGSKILVATAKGYYGPNVDFSKPAKRSNPLGDYPHTYIPNQLAGQISFVPTPTRNQLASYTAEVMANHPDGDSVISPEVKSSIESGAFENIHHVLYVIKENRTYDQVLGDVKKGNGDPRLTIFGESVTPNIHTLVDKFTLLDNLYTDGEVSQAGHQWTDSAYANDYNEKAWILSYSGHGEIESDPRLTSSTGDYIWENARKHGLTARVFGEYVSMQEDHSAANPALVPHLEEDGFSAAFDKIFARGGRDTEKVQEFLSEMHGAEKTGKWWNLMVMALPEDHTRGFSAGRPSPRAMVGSNDLAIGQLIDGISHSPFWKDTAVFIIEDDAQDGPDHVDSHRTEGFVVSPYIKRNNVDHTMYSTCSMLRTIELILRLPPMTQYDAWATPMYNLFTTMPDLTPYSAVSPKTDLDEKNPSTGELAMRSSKLDFSDIDRADPVEFNHILWKGYMGNKPYPTPVEGWLPGR
jgi:YVTN family beta-propeller protein